MYSVRVSYLSRGWGADGQVTQSIGGWPNGDNLMRNYVSACIYVVV